MAAIFGRTKILDEGGVVLLPTTTKTAAQVAIPVTKTDSVWSFEFTTPGDWSFRAWDFPLIQCSTPDAARLIKASVEILPDGTVVCHKFQRRIAELLPKLLAPENVGTADELIVPLQKKLSSIHIPTTAMWKWRCATRTSIRRVIGAVLSVVLERPPLAGIV